jgi:glycosyltransferase involved in cell wall biosynthesis
LEERGIEVGWQVVGSRVTTRADKLKSLLRARPSIVELHEPPKALVPGRWDVVLLAHSYLVPALTRLICGKPSVVDFHNLEWMHLADGMHLERQARPRVSVRQVYLASQVGLMRRLERSIVRTQPLSLFVTESDFTWALTMALPSRAILLRSVLPKAEEQAAARLSATRKPEAGNLVYVGTLTFPTNLMSLHRFLAEDWLEMRSVEPNLRLTIVGACSERDRREIAAHAGVIATGFVDDLTPILARCGAVVMPFGGLAGTSLRALFYALAGLPVIGPSEAFRGLPFSVGLTVRSSKDWAEAARESVKAPEHFDARARTAQMLATAHQADARPWDHLVKMIAELARTSADGI